jgi:DNA-binding NarL/FixJ family response regulator
MFNGLRGYRSRVAGEETWTVKVLIVDDSKLARMAVIKALKNLHPEWERMEAGDAAAAVEMIRGNPPDIALLDYNMPGKDGLTLATEVQALSPRTTVAVISANHQAEVVQRAAASGAAFLPKPLTEKALGEFLHTVSAR